MSEKPNQNSGSDGNSALLAGLVVAAMALYVLWISARPVVVKFFYAPAWIELQLIKHTIGLNGTGQQFLDFVTAVFDGRVNGWNVLWSDVSTVLSLVGHTMRYPFMAIIAAFIFLVATRMKGEGYARKFSLSKAKKGAISFMHYQAQVWQSIKPILNFNPNDNSGNEAPARTPLEWLRDHDISPIQEMMGGPITLPIEETEAAFVSQLGKPWEGLLKAPIHVQVLLVLAALNYSWSKQRQEFSDRAATIFGSSSSAKKKSADIRALLQPHLANRKLVVAVDTMAAKHHYISTVVCAGYDWSRRKGGILPSAEVRWIKKLDRPLWYAINNIGRRSFHTEGAGIIAHYFAEKVNNDPIDKPYVLPAIEGLQSVVANMGISDLDAFFAETDAFALAERSINEEEILAKVRASKGKGRRRKK